MDLFFRLRCADSTHLTPWFKADGWTLMPSRLSGTELRHATMLEF